MADLIALDLPGGAAFVDALRRAWDAGDAIFPIDQRLPPAARTRVVEAMRPSAVVNGSGIQRLEAGLPVEPDDALVVATSGTTGAPKGVVLTHAAVAASAIATNAYLAVTGADHWLACLPIAHVGGLSVVTRALHAGVTLTVLPGFDAEAVGACDATLTSLVPTALQRIDPHRFRAILLGGSRIPADRPNNCVATYGLTETGSGVVYDGYPLDGVEIRVDADGQIHLRCPMLLRGYRDGSNPMDNHGWLATGDLGSLAADGKLTVFGRAGDVINTGGEKVWPEQVEAIIAAMPGVADAAVAGRPDPEWGQVTIAWVVPTDPSAPPALNEIRETVKAELAPYNAPRRLVICDSIPRTAIGKIRRNELEEPT